MIETKEPKFRVAISEFIEKARVLEYQVDLYSSTFNLEELTKINASAMEVVAKTQQRINEKIKELL
jgi:hypothetical protein